ncbi:MAG: hypothetical protein ACD_73C00535G0001 [uncultured bacterium]|nr:MAG: hypothetical protein ACD_73C00535G0001 [uncultured bacterium]
MIGATVETSLKEWIFKLELAGKLTLTNEAMTHSVPYEDGNALPKSYFQYVPSFEHTWQGLMGSTNVTLMAAYYGDTEGASLRNFRPFQNDLFFGARADFNDTHQNQAEIGFVKDLGNSELAFMAQWQMRLYRELKLKIGGLILSPSEGLKTPISFFDNNSQVYSKISYSF